MTKKITVTMVRAHLEDIPQYPLPAGYSIQWYKAGYERYWQEIYLDIETFRTITSDTFAEIFGTDPQPLSHRQCYLFDTSKRVIATATAWYDDENFGQDCGQVHWVAIVPDMQGKGLSKPLITIVCNRLCELGHKCAFLKTETVRIPAVNLYTKFGFVPYIRSAEDLKTWDSLQAKLKEAFDLNKLAQGISESTTSGRAGSLRKIPKDGGEGNASAD